MDKKAYIKPELRATKRVIRPSMICQSPGGSDSTSLKMMKRYKSNDSESQQTLFNPWEAD